MKRFFLIPMLLTAAYTGECEPNCAPQVSSWLHPPQEEETPQPIPQNTVTPQIQEELPPCPRDPVTLVWIPNLQYVGGDGRSYGDGYESVGSFFASYFYPSLSYSFLEVDLRRVERGKGAANAGVGWRIETPDRREMFGINLFYDYRHIEQGNFHQIGLGAEFLGNLWDFRINGYIPVGEKQALIDTTRFAFSGNLFSDRKELRSAMWGVDCEVGGCVLNCGCLSVYTAAGPYFYNSTCCNTFIGGMGRAEVKFTPFLIFQVQATYDPLFHLKVQGQVTFSILFPRLLECLRCSFVPIHRNPIILLEDVCLWESNF